SGLLLLRLAGVRHADSRRVHSAREIEVLLRESSEGGMLAPEEARRLYNALNLGTRTAAQLMVPREQIVALSIDARGQEVLRLASDSPYTRLPVYQGTLDTVVGTLHVKDVVIRQLASGALPPLRTLLRPVFTTPESTPADRLLVMFREQRAQQAIVVGGAGRVVGLVTLEDTLVEVFGELADEFKSRRRSRRKAGQGGRANAKET